MYKYSSWNKVDIHIHSKKSNEVRNNDYEAGEYDATKLLNTLTSRDNGIGIFSITDHNCINDTLYNDIKNLVATDEYKGKINFVIGVELDIKDATVHNEVFHCLCFFDTDDVNLVKESIDDIFGSKTLTERGLQENYPTVKKIFEVLHEKGIKDILLIPHFNRKHRSLPSNDFAIEKLNYLCFNAYEDSNNAFNISKSLKIYLEAGYDNFPFAVFSDSHNIDTYPKDKDGNVASFCYMLSNLEHPFTSIKTAFQEPRLRISINGVDGMRCVTKPEKYISKILIDDEPLYLSPYQNTIIGRFGSGKSLLLEKIRNGMAGLERSNSYKEFYSDSETFKLVIDRQPVDSIQEAITSNRNMKKYEFLQQEDYSYQNILSHDEAKKLFNRLNINYVFVEDKEFNFNKEELINKFNGVKTRMNKADVINNLNYEKAFSNEEFYSANITEVTTNYTNTINTLNTNKTSLQSLKNIKVCKVSIFEEGELNLIDNLSDIIDGKIAKINYINNSNFEESIVSLINNYNEEYINNNSKESKNRFIEDIDNFLESINNFNNECFNFENIYNQSKYNEAKEIEPTDLHDKYKIVAEYKEISQYKSAIDIIVQNHFRKPTLFKSIIKTLYDNGMFMGNTEDFSYKVNTFCTNVNGIFLASNVVYDFIFDGVSLLKRSAGEKSSMFIKLIFDLIENDILNNKHILLILDQPESNIDNDNILNEISNKIKKFKLKYNNFQSLIVTHNANVGITADSENIIIAKEELDTTNGKKTFKYSSGCIENKNFIVNVCNILDGGKAAMEQRTVKYGINIIKKVVPNEF